MVINNMIEKISNLFRCSCGGVFIQKEQHLFCINCGNHVKLFDGIMFFETDEFYGGYLKNYKNNVILPELDYLYKVVQDNDVATVHIKRLTHILNEINNQEITTKQHKYTPHINNMYATEMNNDNYIVSSYSPYIQANFSFSESHYSTLLRLVGKLNDDATILDVGCGLGRVLNDISEYYPYGTVLGCDIQLTKLHLVNRILCGHSKVNYIAIKNFKYMIESISGFNRKNIGLFYADVNNGLPLVNKSMDVIILSFILGLLDDYRDALSNIVQKIKPNGFLIIADDYGWHSSIRSSKRLVNPEIVDMILKEHGFDKVMEMDVPYLGILSDRVANAHIIRLAKYKKY